MVRHCPRCDMDVMPIKSRSGEFKCPKHGWVKEDVDWTPKRMQQRINELQRQFRP